MDQRAVQDRDRVQLAAAEAALESLLTVTDSGRTVLRYPSSSALTLDQERAIARWRAWRQRR